MLTAFAASQNELFCMGDNNTPQINKETGEVRAFQVCLLAARNTNIRAVAVAAVFNRTCPSG